MSRYYRIEIKNPKTGVIITPPGFNGLLGGASYTSFVNGQTLPGAWNVELDIPVVQQAAPQGYANVTIWGISRQEISQASDLNGMNIAVYGGMQKGLPLANPAQAGLLVQGTVFQAYGNWIGTAQTLDLVISPGMTTAASPGGFGTLAQPKNIVLNWKAGTTLSAALKTTLSTAFPGMPSNININAGLVRPNDEVTFYPTLEQLAQYVRSTSRDIIKTANYPGVSIAPDKAGSSLNVYDSSSGTPKQIDFIDLIGQPTWLQPRTVSIKTVMRADLTMGQSILLPKAVVTNTAAAATSIANQQPSFQGSYDIISLRHVGNFRQPSADSWVSVIDATPSMPSS